MPKKRARWRAVRRVRKACWWAFRPVPRSRRSRKKLPELKGNARVFGFNYDTGERYLSIEGFLPAEAPPAI